MLSCPAMNKLFTNNLKHDQTMGYFSKFMDYFIIFLVYIAMAHNGTTPKLATQ